MDSLAPLFEDEKVRHFACWAHEEQSILEQADLPTLDQEAQLQVELLKTHLSASTRLVSAEGELYTSPSFYLQAGMDGFEALMLRYPSPPWSLLKNRFEAFPTLLNHAKKRIKLATIPSASLAQEMIGDSLDGLRECYDHQDVPSVVRACVWDCCRALDDFDKWLGKLEVKEFQPMGRVALDSILRSEHLLQRDSQTWAELALKALDSELFDFRHTPGASPSTDAPKNLSRQDAWQYFIDEVHRVQKFVREADVVTIPPGELELRETPAYLQSLIPGAYYLEPALFSGERTGRFYLPTLPTEWTPQVARRYAARQERGGFANLVVHEAWPGHHVQYLHAVDNHSALANVRDNDVMLEGWALYCEKLLEELGLFGVKPFEPRLGSLKFRIARVVVDVAIHSGQWTLTQAEQFFAETLGTTVSPWIEREIRRYALEPTQAMSYWVGFVLLEEMRLELEIKPDQLKIFHNNLLSFGPIPLPLIRDQFLHKTRQQR